MGAALERTEGREAKERTGEAKGRKGEAKRQAGETEDWAGAKKRERPTRRGGKSRTNTNLNHESFVLFLFSIPFIRLQLLVSSLAFRSFRLDRLVVGSSSRT